MGDKTIQNAMMSVLKTQAPVSKELAGTRRVREPEKFVSTETKDLRQGLHSVLALQTTVEKRMGDVASGLSIGTKVMGYDDSCTLYEYFHDYTPSDLKIGGKKGLTDPAYHRYVAVSAKKGTVGIKSLFKCSVFHGVYKECYQTGELANVEMYYNGKKLHGYEASFRRNGRVMECGEHYQVSNYMGNSCTFPDDAYMISLRTDSKHVDRG